MSEDNQHYIYGHFTSDTNELFYIGQGKKRRAWSTRGRNEHWKIKVHQRGLVVKILEEGLTKDQANQREKELIQAVGIDTLVNMQPGGNGWHLFNDDRNLHKLVETDPYLTKWKWDKRLKLIQEDINRKRNVEKPKVVRRPKPQPE